MPFFQDCAPAEIQLVHDKVGLEEILHREPLGDGRLLRQKAAEHAIGSVAEAQVEAGRLVLPLLDRGLGRDRAVADQSAELLRGQHATQARLTFPSGGRGGHVLSQHGVGHVTTC